MKKSDEKRAFQRFQTVTGKSEVGTKEFAGVEPQDMFRNPFGKHFDLSGNSLEEAETCCSN
jgi:hypothetical protein